LGLTVKKKEEKAATDYISLELSVQQTGQNFLILYVSFWDLMCNIKQIKWIASVPDSAYADPCCWCFPVNPSSSPQS